jgi:hypothetical protein
MLNWRPRLLHLMYLRNQSSRKLNAFVHRNLKSGRLKVQNVWEKVPKV